MVSSAQIIDLRFGQEAREMWDDEIDAVVSGDSELVHFSMRAEGTKLFMTLERRGTRTKANGRVNDE